MSEQFDLFAPRAAPSSSPPTAAPIADPAGACRRLDLLLRCLLRPHYGWRAAWTGSAAWQSEAEAERAMNAWRHRVNRRKNVSVEASRAAYDTTFVWLVARFDVGRVQALVCAPKRAADIDATLVAENARSAALIADVPAEAVAHWLLTGEVCDG